MEKTRVFLVHFVKKFKYLDFCLPELEALADMQGVQVAGLYHERNPRDKINVSVSPCVYVNLPDEQTARRIQERSVLIKEIINVFSQSNVSFEDLVKRVDVQALEKVLAEKKKFRFLFEAVGSKMSSETQRHVIELFRELPFDASLVDLTNYGQCFKVIHNAEDGEIYFGDRVASSRPNEKAEETFHHKYSLKKRPYLGPTSTDHELAVLMANQGQVREGDFVYDPFVGTGSIATALQHFNAFVFGSDLDIRVIKGYAVGRKTKNALPGLEEIEKFDVLTNFTHYKMAHPDFWVQDVHSPMLRTDRPIFDAIVCDPPYGVRAKTKKVGVAEAKQARHEERKAGAEARATDTGQPLLSSLPEDEDDRHRYRASMTERYEQKDIYTDLLRNAAEMLRPGGRVTFLWHIDDQHTEEENRFPEHPSFDFICSSKDVLTKHRARVLITLKKKQI